MQSDQLYVKGDLTATVTMSSFTSNALLMVFYFILRQLGAKNFGKSASFFVSRLARPIYCCQIFYVFRISFLAFRSFFVLLFYVFSLYLVLCFWKPLWLSLCYIACFTALLYRFATHRTACFYKVLKRPCNVSTRRFNKLCQNLLESRALLWQSFLKRV